jgi:P-type Ca2+ transporter type 2B
MMDISPEKEKKEAFLNKKFQNEEALELKIRKSQVEELSIEYFSELFEQSNIDSGKSLEMYNRLGTREGLLKKLGVYYNEGIQISKKEDIQRRIKTFGTNDPIIKEPKTLLELIVDCIQEDKMLKILLVAAFFSLIIGVAQQGWKEGWIEGFSIFLAVFVVVSVSSYNNYTKEKKFALLNKENEKKKVKVKRNGKEVEINNEQLLAGDIIHYEIGNIVGVDSIIIDGKVEVDVSSLTGESKKLKKNPYDDPFLVSGTTILDGECQGVVCAVGVNSVIGRMKMQLQDSEELTPLQERLSVLADQISNFGFIISLVIFIGIVGREAIVSLYNGNGLFTIEILDTILNAIILCVVVICVVVPEGLPMAVTISLAYSVLKMQSEGNAVRHIDAAETMGNVDNICTDKTGTLTEANMKVRSLFFEGVDQGEKRPITQVLKGVDSSNANSNIVLFVKSILFNVNAFIEYENKKPKVKGNSTECALMNFILDSQIDYEKLQDKKLEMVARLPFKSENKYMASIFTDKSSNSYKLFLKGAPEIISNFCNKCAWRNGMIADMDGDNLKAFYDMQNKYSNKSERTLAFAFAEINAKIYEKISAAHENETDSLFKELLNMKNLNMIALVGIADPPRADVKDALNKAQSSGIMIRMITGDNINTALAIANELTILDDYEYNYSKQMISAEDSYKRENQKIYALEGKQFRELSGGYKEISVKKKPKIKDEESEGDSKIEVTQNVVVKKKYVLNDQEKFKNVTENLKVIARASPDDKFLLVLGLKELKHIVAVTGDGTNDAPALKKSDVGFSMGLKGTDIAKEASDIVLLNDTFSSVITALKYGRNIYDCIRKFIQFQLAVNIVAVFMTLLGGFLLKDAPLNPIQMLWVNLIMDSLASLALATEEPSEKLLTRKPYKRGESMITQSMIRNIIVQSICQIFLLTIILFWGDKIFGVKDDRSRSHYEWNDEDGYHYTIFFNIFVFLQVFNSINARKLEQHETNVFENIGNNSIYIYVQFFIVVFQILLIQYGGKIVKTRPLSFGTHFACIIISSLSLVFGYIGKIAPIYKDKDILSDPEFIDKLRNFSSSFSQSLPQRGKSFRANTSTHMVISHKN